MSGAFAPPSTGGSANWASPGTIGSTTPNTAQFTSLTTSGPLIAPPSTTQTLTAASSIACNALNVSISSASAITLTSNPQIAAGQNGQKIVITNVGSNGITFVGSNGLLMPQNIPLYGGKALSFTYLSIYSSWVCDLFIPESLALTGASTTPTPLTGTNTTQIANTAFVINEARPIVEARRSTTQSIAVNNTTTLICNVEDVDTDNAYNAATGVFTVPSGKGGVYFVAVFISASNPSSNFQIAPVKNGAIQENLRSTGVAYTTDIVFWISHCFKIRLAAGDAFRIDFYYGSVSGAATTTGSPAFPTLFINRVY